MLGDRNACLSKLIVLGLALGTTGCKLHRESAAENAAPAPVAHVNANPWSTQGNNWLLSIGEGGGSSRRFTVAAAGGRISSFIYAGQELLHPGVDQLQGSTFWPSPQADWGWPPPAELDSQPYSAVQGKVTIKNTLNGAEEQRDALTLTSAAFDPKTSLALAKTFTFDAARNAVQIDYTLINKASTARKVSPWEITRVPLGGLVYFPKESDFHGDAANEKLMPTQEDSTALWLQSSKQTTNNKLFRDGAEAWVAHSFNGMLLVKRYQENISTADFAPAPESEVELYVNPDQGYVEVEVQGRYAELAPGAQRTWTVWWYATQLPQDLAQEGPGSALLLQFTRGLLKNP